MPRLQTPRILKDPATPKAKPPLNVFGINVLRVDEHRRVRHCTKTVNVLDKAGKPRLDKAGKPLTEEVPAERHEVTLEAGATFLVRGGPNGRDVVTVNWEDFAGDERLLIKQALKTIEKKAAAK
jgi:hypothetical protein